MDTDEEPMLFKAQLFALTGVQPHRQKVILKGAVLKDDPTGWDVLKPKLKNGVTLLMMGTKDENALVALKESDKPQVITRHVLLDPYENGGINSVAHEYLPPF